MKEFHSDAGRKIKNFPITRFWKESTPFRNGKSKEELLIGMLDSFNSGNQALKAKKLFFDLWFYQPDERADLKSTFNPRTFCVMFECF